MSSTFEPVRVFVAGSYSVRDSYKPHRSRDAVLMANEMSQRFYRLRTLADRRLKRTPVQASGQQFLSRTELVMASCSHGRTLAFSTCKISLLLMLFSGVLGGCGYSSRRPFPDGVQTVYVEMFQSKEFRRELEFRLTEALVKRIEMDTPYHIAPRQTADAILSGEILEVKNRTFGHDFDDDLPRETGSTIVVRFRFQDMRSGETLVERPRFVFQTSYIPPAGETFTEGMTRGLDGLAEAMVESMESDW